MNWNITKIRDVSSGNYGDRQGRQILHIVIGMTNNAHSGNAYAKSYRQQLSPRITYNYVIDKLGNVYQTIPDEYAPYTVNSSSSSRQVNNQECISICFMPEWNGSSLTDEYDNGTKFPKDAEAGQEFLLTKSIKINGSTYPTGLYEYDGVDWIIEEEITIEDIKRPYDSDDWDISQECEEALLNLVKWLQNKYNVITTNVLRVYDYFKTYNPAPYIYDEGENWESFRDSLNDLELEEKFRIIPESSPSGEDITATDEEKEIATLIEQYGPDAGENIDNSFKADSSSITDTTVNLNSWNKYTFELGIHDTLKTNIVQEGETTKSVTSGKLWHITDVTRQVSWKTHLEENCDELDFEFHNEDNKAELREGFNIGYWMSGIGGFNGNIFTLSQSGENKELISGTAYGWLRYLKCDGWTTFENMTASQVFEKVCNIANIPHKVITPSSYICKTATCAGDTLYSAVQKAIYETMVYEKKWYIIQPFFDQTGGGIQFVDILWDKNIKQIKFDEESAILSWDFESSIDESANIIVTYTEGDKDEETGKTSITATGSVKDESTIQEWGRLTKVIQDQKPAKDSGGTLNVSADQWLTFYNSPRRTIRLNCMGIPGIIAGNIIYLEIFNVVSIGTIQGCLVVDECTHKIENGKHTMDLICEIVRDGTIQAQIYNALIGKHESNKLATEAEIEVIKNG